MSEPGPRCGTLEAWVGTFPSGTMPTLPIRKKIGGPGRREVSAAIRPREVSRSSKRWDHHFGVRVPQKPTFHNIPGLSNVHLKLPPLARSRVNNHDEPTRKSHYTRLAKPPESGEGKEQTTSSRLCIGSMDSVTPHPAPSPPI